MFEAVKNEENKASVYNLEELCDYIEKELLKEQEGLKLETKDSELDLENVSLGFHSGSEDEGEDPNETSEYKGKFIDESRIDEDEKSEISNTENENFEEEVKIDFLNEETDLQSLRMFEDAKDYLLEAAEHLASGIKAVNFLK